MNFLIPVFFIFLGNYFGRKFDQLIGEYFLKGTLDKVFVYFICLIWGIIIAFGSRELILHYNLKIILAIICYGAGLYVSNIFYQDNRADFIYGDHFTEIINWITIIVYIITSILLYFMLK